MNVETIKARLAEIQGQIPGVRRAYMHGPAALPAGDLPCFVNFTGAATHDWARLGAERDWETRQYLMRLYIREVQSGIDGEAEARCEPFFARVRDAFAARPGLDGLSNVQIATLAGDSGLAVLSYAGQEYAGIEFRLQVVMIVPRGYESGE